MSNKLKYLVISSMVLSLFSLFLVGLYRGSNILTGIHQKTKTHLEKNQLGQISTNCTVRQSTSARNTTTFQNIINGSGFALMKCPISRLCPVCSVKDLSALGNLQNYRLVCDHPDLFASIDSDPRTGTLRRWSRAMPDVECRSKTGFPARGSKDIKRVVEGILMHKEFEYGYVLLLPIDCWEAYALTVYVVYIF
jgi:hypothetical protein